MSIESILQVCRTIKHDRDISSAFVHLKGEVNELDDEISAVLYNQSPNEDGVIGEAVDCILCLVDIIYHEDNSVSSEEIDNIVNKKLAKWKSVYGVDEKTEQVSDFYARMKDIEFYNAMHHPSQHIQISQVDKLKLKLYGPNGVGCTNFNFSRGSANNVTDEQIAAEINKVIEQIETGNIEICQNT